MGHKFQLFDIICPQKSESFDGIFFVLWSRYDGNYELIHQQENAQHRELVDTRDALLDFFSLSGFVSSSTKKSVFFICVLSLSIDESSCLLAATLYYIDRNNWRVRTYHFLLRTRVPCKQAFR